MKTDDSNEKFESMITKNLKALGYDIPTTDEEIRKFEKDFDEQSVVLPASLENAMEILKRGEVKIRMPHDSENIADTVALLAARNGNPLSDEIREKMNADRLKAEQDAEEKDSKP